MYLIHWFVTDAIDIYKQDLKPAFAQSKNNKKLVKQGKRVKINARVVKASQTGMYVNEQPEFKFYVEYIMCL